MLHHSPSGAEAEIDQLLMKQFAALGVEVWQDRADNVIAKIPGRDLSSAIAITALRMKSVPLSKQRALRIELKYVS